MNSNFMPLQSHLTKSTHKKPGSAIYLPFLPSIVLQSNWPSTCPSLKNMVYIMVCYLHDRNTVIVRSMASRTNAFIVKAFKEVIKYFDSKGCTPILNVMDKKCFKAVEEAYISSQDVDIQLDSPRNHHVNAAEKAIVTFKEHFIAALPTLINIIHSMQLWDKSLEEDVSLVDLGEDAYEGSDQLHIGLAKEYHPTGKCTVQLMDDDGEDKVRKMVAFGLNGQDQWDLFDHATETNGNSTDTRERYHLIISEKI